MDYQNADRLLLGALPELAVPYGRCIEGGHEGQYIVFEDLFARFIEVLLALPADRGRDTLLQRAFDFVELMQPSEDRDVRDLANISIFEGRSPWWFGRAREFIGPLSRSFLEQYKPSWRLAQTMQAPPDLERDIIDVYGVRDAVFAALGGKIANLADIPGINSPRSWAKFESLQQARGATDGTIFLSCYGTSDPYVIGPASDVVCDELTLVQLVRDLADIADEEPDQREKSASACYAIPVGERVWRMRVGEEEHGRYRRKLWIAPSFVEQGLEEPIRRVLTGEQPRLHGTAGSRV